MGIEINEIPITQFFNNLAVLFKHTFRVETNFHHYHVPLL